MIKTIKISISSDDFPMLFKVNNNELGELCYNIFEQGYKSQFPDTNNNNNNDVVMKNMIHHTDSIKHDLKLLDQKINVDDINNKLDDFSDIIEQLFGITNNSTKKGKITEELIYNMLKNKFNDYAIEETRGVNHSGDAIIHIPKMNNKVTKVMVEIKNYNSTVDTDEIEKMRHDMKYTKIKFGIFISIKSGFVGKKQMAIEEFKYDDDIYTILYVPNLFDDLNKIEASVLLIDKLIDHRMNKQNDFINLKWLENSVVAHLTKLDNLYTEYNKLKNSFFKMEKNIKQSISDHYSNVMSYENILKHKINDIWTSINKDFGDAEKELIGYQKSDILNIMKSNKCNKNVIMIVKILLKHGLYVDIIKPNKFWHIMKINDGIMFGTIVKSKNIQISFDNPMIKFDIESNKNIDTNLLMLDNILSTL
jgi:hypothetical protein